MWLCTCSVRTYGTRIKKVNVLRAYYAYGYGEKSVKKDGGSKKAAAVTQRLLCARNLIAPDSDGPML